MLALLAKARRYPASSIQRHKSRCNDLRLLYLILIGGHSSEE